MSSLSFAPIKFVKEDSKYDSTISYGSTNNANITTDGGEIRKFYETLLSDKTTAELTRRQISTKPKIMKKKSKEKSNQSMPHLTPIVLFKAATEGDVNLVEKCFKNGIDINSFDEFKWTPLMCAAFAGHYKVVEDLLINGADRNFKNLKGQTASDLATLRGFCDILFLIDNFSQPNLDEETTTEISTASCSECKVDYNDPDHATSTLHLLKTMKSNSSEKPYFLISNVNKGYQMLVKEGWNESSGLGYDGSGRKYPVKTLLKRDRLGLGTKTGNKPRVTHFASNDVQAIKSVERAKNFSIKKFNKRREQIERLKQKEWERNFRRQFH